MNFFKKLFGSSKAPETQDTRSAPQSHELGDLTEAEAANLAVREAGAACLDRHWSAVGTVERDVLAYLISPTFSGGPYWPSTRQAYRVVRRGDAIILATEGLSDPFDDTEGMGNGFEMELFVETADIPEHAYGPVGGRSIQAQLGIRVGGARRQNGGRRWRDHPPTRPVRVAIP